MNDQYPNNERDQEMAQKLNQVSEHTHANPQFAAELEERLRRADHPKVGWFATAFHQISPVVRWAVLMILLAVALSWSIKTLIPTPQPAADNTPVFSDTATPTSDLVTSPTGTPIITGDGTYDWRGIKLTLAVPLPESPAEANVFIIQPEQPATLESVHALADRFGLQGEIFEINSEPNASSAFSLVDGNQRLNVRSDRYFEYISDVTLVGSENRFSLSNPNAEAIIAEFMTSHNFTFPYTVEPSELYQGFYVQAVTPDGLPMHHEFFMQNGLLFRLDETRIVSVSGSLLKYDQVGTYGIKSAEEAFQQVVAATEFNGMIEGIHSSEKPPQTWNRSYPNNETVTLYGFMNVNPSADGTQSLISIDKFVARGNLAGAENLEKLTLVKVTGHFTLENEDQVFNVESWEIYKRDDHGYSGKDTFMGTLQKQGDDVVIVSEKGTFIMPDVSADVPLPLENAYVHGIALGDILEWEGIAYFEGEEAGGGGGSNGNGFYKLNLSGPPLPFPGPGNYIVKKGDHCGSIAAQFGVSIQSIIDQNQLSADCFISVGQTLIVPVGQAGQTPGISIGQASFGTTEYIVQENDTLASIASNFGITVEELKQANDIAGDVVYLGQALFIPGQQTENPSVGRRFEKQRGILVITIYKQPDGSSRNEFVFIMKNEDGPVFHALLENVSLEALREYHNLPLDIWGTVERVDQNDTPVISVERYEVAFPDLQIRLLQGKQNLTEVEGQQVLLFTTTQGTTYAQMLMYGVPDALTILGVEGGEVILEALAMPGETFGDYPTLYVFSAAMAISPKNNQPTEMTIRANQPYMVDEMPNNQQLDLSSATIKEVELVYYIPDPRYASFGELSSTEYIQPAWRFHGHYENGDEFEILIQALKQEYLIPELAPFTRPG
jgi:LysM repeat protein